MDTNKLSLNQHIEALLERNDYDIELKLNLCDQLINDDAAAIADAIIEIEINLLERGIE